MVEICLCDLSGDFHVIKNGGACELCREYERMKFTPENVEKAFKEYQRRLAERTKQ